MKKRSTLFLVLAIAIGLSGALTARAEDAYNALSLGHVAVYGLNNSGQAVGYYVVDQPTGDQQIHTYITGANGIGMTDLGVLGYSGNTSWAQGINDSGQVVGKLSVSSSTYHAFITGANGAGVTDLGTLDTGSKSCSIANAINASGQVVGWYSTSSYTYAFVTGANGVGMTKLGTLGGDTTSASAINDKGQVVGFANVSGNPHAFITSTDGTSLTDIGILSGGNYSYATGINASGLVVGYSQVSVSSTLTEHAFITGADGVGMTDLGTLGGNASKAYGINDSGEVVGQSLIDDGTTWHAFVTGADGVMIDLNTLVTLADGDYLKNAKAINDLGQIVAVSAAGNAYLLSTVPEPSTIVLLCGAGIAGTLWRYRRRLFFHKAALGRKDCC